VGQEGNYVARLEPTTGKFTRFEIDPGTNPHHLIVDAKGRVWYAGNRNGMIGRLDGESGAITRYPMPDPAVRDPHTLVFDRTQEHIWFSAQQSG
jgi:virginiamycin B lyase